ncbi:sensor histidine kinase [Paenibacillus sp. SYP-B3998]|uniref:histidine kinase n=1 Tax=Paenibacillus sp. SYP-B3998 TaxID=2678564 RepID=A0A6G3ZUA3_9BACL|nr:sensor histidine kinase [Paenibacillus sp. SYP-B3998]NEW05796.1 sensor histidine kinase [Paenibacillus sp. SYP-B3998]
MRWNRWLYLKYVQNTQVRLTCYFLIVLLPLVAVSLYANEVSRQMVLEQSMARTENSLTSVAENIDLTLQNVEELSKLVATSPDLLQMLDKADCGLTPESIVDFTQLLSNLWNITSISQSVSEISVYHAGTGTILSTKMGGKRVQDNSHKEWLMGLAEMNGATGKYVFDHDEIPGGGTVGALIGADSISLVRTMDLHSSRKKWNLLIITLNQSRLSRLMDSVIPSTHASIDLYTKSGKWVSGAAGGLAHSSSRQAADLLKIQVDTRYYGWSLVLQQPKEEIYGKTMQIRSYTYVIIGVSVLLAILIAWGVYTRISSPLHKLTYAIKELSIGDLNVRINVDREDEFGYLMKAYNQMAEYQKHLIEDYYEQQLQLAHTELKFLQAQINPHFLYNTLDSIYWTAKNYDADEISEMVLNLSRFFRLSLNKGKESFSVEETIAHLDYYIRVQQIRFLDSFTVTYRIQEESRNVPIFKLLLQPLVENAILHGLETRANGGELVIASKVQAGALLLSVQDNGAGIEKERLVYIQKKLEQIAERDRFQLTRRDSAWTDLYGLLNVLSRIHMLYGSEAGMWINSREGEGTTVTVCLPLDRCSEDFHLGSMAQQTERTEEMSS